MIKLNPKKVKSARRPRATKFGVTVAGGNRHKRRADKAFAKRLPMIERQSKIERNLKETKELGRIAKQKHIDAIKIKNLTKK